MRINDALASAVVVSWGRLASETDAKFEAFGGYNAAIAKLNGASGTHGYVWATYSPGSLSNGEFERRYFTAENAARIDGARAEIGRWKGHGYLSVLEERLLMADLLVAANRVANTAGTYGCFLREWAPNALRPFVFTARRLAPDRMPVEASVGDVADVAMDSGDTAYFDPPYTKRQYAAYYHVLETITLGDEPVVAGITGLRPWKHKASAFSYRTRALDAIVGLVTTSPARRSFLSYSSAGHASLDALASGLSLKGAVRVYPLGSVRAYSPSAESAREGVSEFLLQYAPNVATAVA